jgi:cytochrome bd-type quinol oxidase subunit 2
MAVIELHCKGSKQAEASKKNLTIALGVAIPVILVVVIASSFGYWSYRRKKVYEGQNR